MTARFAALVVPVALAACAVAPFEPTLRPPVDLLSGPAATAVPVRDGFVWLFETGIRNRHESEIRIERATAYVGERTVHLETEGELAAAMRESGRPLHLSTPTVPAHGVRMLLWFVQGERGSSSGGGLSIEARGWPGPGDRFTLEQPWSASSPPLVVLDAPVRGGDWQVLNGIAPGSVHRRHVNVFEKTPYVAQRQAVDLVRVRPDGSPRRTGTTAWNEGFLAFGEPVLAPVDGEVVAAVDGVPDNTGGPWERSVEITMKTVAGNHVWLRIGNDGPYVLLAHFENGSVAVRPGDRVTAGQELGRIGNSGNSTEPHLHLHVADRPDVLRADGRAFAFRSFSIVRPNRRDPAGITGPRTNEALLDRDVVRF